MEPREGVGLLRPVKCDAQVCTAEEISRGTLAISSTADREAHRGQRRQTAGLAQIDARITPLTFATVCYNPEILRG
jgi:hypothetical protein